MNIHQFNIYLSRPSDIAVIKALCKYNSAEFTMYGKTIQGRYCMRVEASLEAIIKTFELYSFDCRENQYDEDNEHINYNVNEEEMIADLQKESDYANEHEWWIRNTRISMSIQIIIEHRNLQIEVEEKFSEFIELHFRTIVDSHIRTYGMLIYDDPDKSWWVNLTDLAQNYIGSDPDFLKLSEIIEQIKSAEKK